MGDRQQINAKRKWAKVAKIGTFVFEYNKVAKSGECKFVPRHEDTRGIS